MLLIDRLPEVQIFPETHAHARHEIYNLGHHRPVALLHFVEVLEQLLGKKARKHMLPMQPGEVLETYADIKKMQALGWQPETSIEEGLDTFVQWWKGVWHA